MGDTSITDAPLDQIDEEILAYEVSDEALEVAAGTAGSLRPVSLTAQLYTLPVAADVDPCC